MPSKSTYRVEMPDHPRDPTPPETVVLWRYLDEACTDAERLRVEQWLTADPVANEAQLGVLRGIIRGIARVEPGRFDVRGARQRMLDRIAEAGPDPVAARGATPEMWPRGMGGRTTIQAVALGIGMTIALAAGVILVIWRSPAVFESGVQRSAARLYSTRAAERLALELEDDTRVTLAPASRLRVSRDYGNAHTREVALEGQAHFVVVHDTKHPFVVKAGGAVATDVGTAFDVRAYAGEAAVRLMVTEGEICVGVSRTPCTHSLQVGDVAQVSDADITIRHGADVAAETAWMGGDFVLNRVPFRDAIADIDRWYDLDLRLADVTLGDRLLAVRFRGEPVAHVLEAIALLTHARYARAGRIVTFTPVDGNP